MRSVTWAGRLLVALGALHLVVTAAISAPHLGTWVRGGLWLPVGGLGEPAVGAFWLSVGSFGVPLVLLGGMVTWAARLGHTPPAFVGWGIAAWIAVCALILEPSPFALGLIPAAMLVRAGRRRGTVPATISPAPSTGTRAG
ncbi:DUF6463 family protein [Pseudonocardia nigra]|uniref:DUF6463 family protein n=1 Tax=Pseudonocardia nigra TaxID=1921578 RepID=UPI001FE27D33|nr:DUF6463 family protein [Pseudonocardia nigra]